jgi:hypothetical protein
MALFTAEQQQDCCCHEMAMADEEHSGFIVLLGESL